MHISILAHKKGETGKQVSYHFLLHCGHMLFWAARFDFQPDTAANKRKKAHQNYDMTEVYSMQKQAGNT